VKTFKFGTSECLPTDKPHVSKRVIISVQAETLEEAKLLAVPQVKEGERIVYWFEDRPYSRSSDAGVSRNAGRGGKAGRDEGAA
jgi:hypothetical protein